MSLAFPLRFRIAIARFFAWVCALWCGAGACFCLWCAFCLGTGRWKSGHPTRDAAVSATGSVFALLFAWFCIRVVFPLALRAQDRQMAFIREHGGLRHALKAFLFGELGDGPSKPS